MDASLFLVIAILPLAFFIIAPRWKLAISVAMILMVFEGALRKWLFPGFAGPLYFVKDVLVLVGYGGFLVLGPKGGVHAPFFTVIKALLVANLFFDVLQVFNPSSPSLLLGLIGLKSYLLYAALIFIVPFAFQSHDDFSRKLNFYMLLMIPVALLGLVQFASPSSSFINTYASNDPNSEVSIATFGNAENHVRASGTFAYIGGYGTFVIAMFDLSLAFVLAPGRKLSEKKIPFFLLISTTLAMFTTGSRGVVVGVGISIIFVVLLSLSAGQMAMGLAMRMLIGGGILTVVSQFFAGDAIDAFAYRALNSDSNIDRLLSPITDLLIALDGAPLFGFGIGTTHNSAASIMGLRSYWDMWWLNGLIFEAEMSRIVVELGIIGFILVISVRLIFCYLSLSMVYILKTPLFKILSAGIAGFCAFHLGAAVINNPTANLYFWFAGGMLFAMYRLDCSLNTPRRTKL